MYSQHGEDIFLEEFLIKNNILLEPLFVDVGAYDGVEGSNSRLFKKYGYKIIAVDLHKKVLDSGADVIHQVVLSGDGEYYKLEKVKDPTLQNIKKSTKSAKTAVKTKKLSSLIKSYPQVGILSIDIENMTQDVLIEVMKNYKGEIQSLIVEGNTVEERVFNQEFLEKRGYNLLATMNVNQIYILNKFL